MTITLYSDTLNELRAAGLTVEEMEKGAGKDAWADVHAIVQNHMTDVRDAINAIDARHEAAMREALTRLKASVGYEKGE